MTRLYSAACLVALFLASACSSNPVDPGTDGQTGGNTGGSSDDGVSFSARVLPIFTSSCAGGGCHTPETTSGVNLSSYASVTTSVGDQYGSAIVVAGDANASPLYEKVAGTVRFGARMPLGRAQLSAAEKNAIRDWINEGAKNN